MMKNIQIPEVGKYKMGRLVITTTKAEVPFVRQPQR